MTHFGVDTDRTLILLTQLRLPGDRVADRLEERCPRSGTRFATFGTPSRTIFDVLVEYGHADLKISKVNSHVDRLFAGLGDEIPVFMSHFDKLVSLPTDFVVVATTKNSEYAGIAHQEKPIFGVQFHPELEHTPRGSEILRNFSVDICGAQPNWKMGDFVQLEITRIRELVGDRALVLGAVSGGVDSTVGAALMKAAIGDRFKAILIDNGCMRLNECEQVKQTLGEHLGINLTVVDAGDLFLGRLAGVSDPEKKRKIIGSTFIDLFEQEAIRIEKEAENTPNSGKVEWFLQGTLYPDVIESLSFRGPSATIKTHHNVGGLPERMMNGQGLRLIEPLRLLFKDEVRVRKPDTLNYIFIMLNSTGNWSPARHPRIAS
jgi:GMP synthase (glutamine-hydrolysing)